MSWLKRNPYFYLSLALLMLAAVGGMWYTSRDAERLAALKSQYDTKNQQLQLFLKRVPAPTKANLEVLDENYELLASELDMARSALNLSSYNPDLFFGPSPADSNDAFFMIAKYVEDTRRLAVSSGIATVEGSRYGFSQYENLGPVSEAIPRVHKQAKIMESLLQALFDSGISEFVSIQREASLVGESQPKRTSVRDTGDIFSLREEDSVRRGGSFDTLAFRLEFKGQSLSMRSFLNRVTGSSLPFSINEIEVRLDHEMGSAEERSSIRDNPFVNSENMEQQMSAVRVPIISENESRFIVTLEFLELVDDVVASENSERENGNV